MQDEEFNKQLLAEYQEAKRKGYGRDEALRILAQRYTMKDWDVAYRILEVI